MAEIERTTIRVPTATHRKLWAIRERIAEIVPDGVEYSLGAIIDELADDGGEALVARVADRFPTPTSAASG